MIYVREQDILEVYIKYDAKEDHERKEQVLDNGYKLHSVVYDSFQHRMLYVFTRTRLQ